MSENLFYFMMMVLHVGLGAAAARCHYLKVIEQRDRLLREMSAASDAFGALRYRQGLLEGRGESNRHLAKLGMGRN